MPVNLNQPPIPRAPLPSATSDKAYNQLVDQVQAMGRTLTSQMVARGDDRPTILGAFFGLTTSKPPKGVADFKTKDARYWITRAQLLPKISLTDQIGVQTDDFANSFLYDPTVPATNLAELPAQKDDHTVAASGGTHTLPDNTVVLVFAMAAKHNPAKIFFVFTLGGTGGVLLRVLATTWSDSTVLGQGWYRARIVTSNVASADPTAAANESTLYTSGSTDVLLLNRLEIGLTKRLVDPSGNTVVFEGVSEPAITTAGTFKGVAVYSTDGLQPKVCSNGA